MVYSPQNAKTCVTMHHLTLSLSISCTHDVLPCHVRYLCAETHQRGINSQRMHWEQIPLLDPHRRCEDRASQHLGKTDALAAPASSTHTTHLSFHDCPCALHACVGHALPYDVLFTGIPGGSLLAGQGACKRRELSGRLMQRTSPLFIAKVCLHNASEGKEKGKKEMKRMSEGSEQQTRAPLG